MKVCVYDNPSNMQREAWQDGVKIWYCDSAMFLLRNIPDPRKWLFFGANKGPWKTGQLYGDPDAMNISKDNTKV